MKDRIQKELSGMFHNLANGLRLAVFRRVSLNEFHVSYDQLAVLTILITLIAFIISLIASLPSPEFSVYGIKYVSTTLFFLAIGAYLFSKFSNKKDHILPLFILILSIWVAYLLLWLLLGSIVVFKYWQLYGGRGNLYALLNAWLAAVIVITVKRNFDLRIKGTSVVLVIYMLVILVPLNYLYFDSFWHKSYKENYNKYRLINQEETYYKQFQLIENAKSKILPQRRGVNDIYFVGFGSYAYQDVFMKEVKYARKVLDKRFGTKGRSAILINNRKTIDALPLANKSNLSLLLNHLGKIMNPEEDVLFLYLTSHGSKDHYLSVNLTSLSLNSINPQDLKELLKRSGIKYRIILVSSCYSGGFVNPLKNDYTVVFTASAKDKQSFGCSSKSDFTYFGKAIFKEQMEKNYNILSSFKKAILSIRKRERAERLKSSDPQLFIGNKIRKKLHRITRYLERRNGKKRHGGKQRKNIE